MSQCLFNAETSTEIQLSDKHINKCWKNVAISMLSIQHIFNIDLLLNIYMEKLAMLNRHWIKVYL